MKIRLKIIFAFATVVIFAAVVILVSDFFGVKYTAGLNPDSLLMLFAVLFAGGLISSIIISKNISSGLKKLNSFLKRFFSSSDLSEEIKNSADKRNDDFKQIFKELSGLYDTYKKYVDFAEEIKKGNFKAEYNFSEKDKFAGILNEISNNLQTLEKERKYNISELEQNRWYRSGVTDFTLLLQQDFKSTEEMAYPVIKKLAEHLSVEQAGIFVLKNINEKDILVLEAAYAYDKKKQLDTEVEIGESLVGKCAKEKKLTIIDDLPEGYTYISSGLGEDTPQSLILAPLLYEKKLFGVLEIASLKKIPDYKINFLNVITERIAAEIYNINTKKLTSKLAEDYKKQSEELALRDKRSNDTINKLESEKQQLLQMNNSFLSQIETFNKYLPVIFVNSEGIITKLNDAAAKTYDLNKNDVLNKPYLDCFPDVEKDIFDKVLKGNEIVLKRKTENAETVEKFIPVSDKKDGYDKIIITAFKLS